MNSPIEEFRVAIADDLNTPKALAALEDMLGQRKIRRSTKLQWLKEMESILGLRLESLKRKDLRVQPKDAQITPEEIEAELDRRQTARAEKDFALSDEIRDALIARGVEVMDGDPLRWDWRLTLA